MFKHEAPERKRGVQASGVRDGSGKRDLAPYAARELARIVRWALHRLCRGIRNFGQRFQAQFIHKQYGRLKQKGAWTREEPKVQEEHSRKRRGEKSAQLPGQGGMSRLRTSELL